MKKTIVAIKLMLLVVAATTFTACSKLTAANFEKIHNEMTTEQVKELLGEPDQIKSGSFFGVSGTVYVYRKDKTEVTITFVQDKVFGKDGSFAQ